MWLERIRPWQVVVLAGLVRAALICWAEYQDRHLPVKYTDIDYVVFTDAARFVAAGGSPYQRDTYRYSPLLSYLLLPNIWLHPAWGKVLFSASDLAAAGLMHTLLRHSGATQPLRTAALLLWLFNPYTATISTRGSCDVLSVLLLLGLLLGLLYGRPLTSGALYGLAVHFRIYPVIYGPAIALYLTRRAIEGGRCRGPPHAPPDGLTDPWDKTGTDDAAAAAGTAADPVESGAKPQPPPPLPAAAAVAAVAAAAAAVTPVDHGLRHRRSGMKKNRAAAAAVPPPNAGDSDAADGDAGELTGARRHRLVRQRLPMWRLPPPLSDIGSGAAAGAAALRPAALFGAAAAASFALLAALFYKLYGKEFLTETFLHHLTRKDPRHNFSPYYYPVYLSYGRAAGPVYGDQTAAAASRGGGGAGGALLGAWRLAARVVPLDEPWRLAMLPQAAALLALAVRFHEDLPSAWLLQTWCFVTLNKVVTAQYFVWYLSLLPLALPALAAQRAVSYRVLAAAGVAWVAAQLHWLGWAYQLEMRGASVHLALWVAALIFQAANTAMLVALTRALMGPLRRAGGASGGGGGGAGGGAATAGAAGGASTTFLEASLALTRRRCPPRPFGAPREPQAANADKG